jgi:parallel beta-helix repeat protein
VVLLVGSGNTVTRIVAQENIGTRETDYGDGIALFGSSNNTIRGNTAQSNGVYSGISLVGNSDNNLVDSNVVQGNAASGIRVNSTNNAIRSNTAVQNARRVNQGTINAGGAFDLHDTRPGSDANVWRANTYGTRSQPCIN